MTKNVEVSTVELVKQVMEMDGITKSEKMRQMYDFGMSVSEISKMMSSHYSFVYGVIQKHTDGLIRETVKESKSDKIREMYDTGMTVGDIAKQLNSNYSYVFTVVKKHREKN